MSGCWRGSQRGRGGTGHPGETRRGPGGLGRGGVRGGSQSWGGLRGPGGPRGAAGFLVSARGARTGLRGHRVVPEGTGGGSHKEPGWWGGPSRLCPPQPHQPTHPPPQSTSRAGPGPGPPGADPEEPAAASGPGELGGLDPPGNPSGPAPPRRGRRGGGGGRRGGLVGGLLAEGSGEPAARHEGAGGGAGPHGETPPSQGGLRPWGLPPPQIPFIYLGGGEGGVFSSIPGPPRCCQWGGSGSSFPSRRISTCPASPPASSVISMCVLGGWVIFGGGCQWEFEGGALKNTPPPSLQEYLGVPNEPPIDIQFQPSGYLFLASPEKAATLEATVQLQRWGGGGHPGGCLFFLRGGSASCLPPPTPLRPQERRGAGGPAVPCPAEGQIPLDRHGGRGRGVLRYEVGGHVGPPLNTHQHPLPHPHQPHPHLHPHCTHPSPSLYLEKGRSSSPHTHIG